MIAHYNGKIPILKFIKVLQEEIKVCCGLSAGRKPRSISIVIPLNGGTIEHDHFASTPCVKLKSDHNSHKGHDTTLMNHTAKHHVAHVDHIPIIYHKGLFCLYSMTKLHINSLMPPSHLLMQDVGFGKKLPKLKWL